MTFFGYNYPGAPTSNIPPIFWEPDNLRGRALASFDAQVGISSPTGPAATNVNGVITPLDYLVGLMVSGTPGGLQGNTFGQTFFVQPIVFSCPATEIFGSNSGVTFCGTQGGGGGQVADLPTLGVRNTWTAAPFMPDSPKIPVPVPARSPSGAIRNWSDKALQPRRLAAIRRPADPPASRVWTLSAAARVRSFACSWAMAVRRR